jgi:hypothetical protein
MASRVAGVVIAQRPVTRSVPGGSVEPATADGEPARGGGGAMPRGVTSQHFDPTLGRIPGERGSSAVPAPGWRETHHRDSTRSL